MSRRRGYGIRFVALWGALLLFTGALAACGSGGGAETGAGGAVTIKHMFGETRVESTPKRVVTLGGGDMETAIALGVVPVAGADWFGYTTTRTWVKTALGTKKAPELIQSYQPKFEKIAAYRPDLILYVNSLNDPNQYKTLAKIAPTIAAPAGVKNTYGVGWRNQVRLIAKALGRTARGEQVINETQGLVAKTAKAHPEFAGKTVSAGVYSAGRFSLWLPSDPRMQLLAELGFKANPKISQLNNGDFYVQLSNEQLDRMNADIILLAAQDQNGRVDPGIPANQVYAGLPAVKAGHVAYFGGAPVISSNTPSGQFASAYSIGGPLGIKYSVDRLAALLATGIAGKR